jgi:hypothetical protein
MSDSSASPLPRGLFPTEGEIAQLAFNMFFEQDRRRWRYVDCFRRAEDELLQRAARRAIPDRRTKRRR